MPNMCGPEAVKVMREMGFLGPIFGVTGKDLGSDSTFHALWIYDDVSCLSVIFILSIYLSLSFLFFISCSLLVLFCFFIVLHFQFPLLFYSISQPCSPSPPLTPSLLSSHTPSSPSSHTPSLPSSHTHYPPSTLPSSHTSPQPPPLTLHPTQATC